MRFLKYDDIKIGDKDLTESVSVVFTAYYSDGSSLDFIEKFRRECQAVYFSELLKQGKWDPLSDEPYSVLNETAVIKNINRSESTDYKISFNYNDVDCYITFGKSSDYHNFWRWLLYDHYDPIKDKFNMSVLIDNSIRG